MTEEIVARVRALQRPMLEEAASCFEQSELEHLRVVVRLAVEFYYHVEGRDQADLRYVSDSIYSGLESFRRVNDAYNVLHGSRRSDIDWKTVHVATIQDEFKVRFEKFEREQAFEERCRLLLDMFKLQLVFAAVSYQ
jgi:hypothetical protein